MEVYERLDDLDADKALVRAGKILFGLGFSKSMQHNQVKNFSGEEYNEVLYSKSRPRETRIDVSVSVIRRMAYEDCIGSGAVPTPISAAA